MVTLSGAVTIILTLSAVVLVFFLSMVLYRVASILSRVDAEVTPIIKRLETTIDEVNLELARLDEIVKAGESVAEKVNATTRLAQEAIASPLIRMISLSAGVKKAFDRMAPKRKKEK